MNLNEIHDPSFLKDMSTEQMYSLAGDIRKFLISSISRTGGHLASNLGVVELTIALHYVFNSPEDRIFFDVGHQCYVHKILTGRADRFSTLRQYNGLSGFQKRNESAHDVWEAGHSSTSLSAALGMAVARDLRNENYHVIPVIGDGALSSGMSLEALNEIGYEKKNMIIVFNDNNMSISKNVGAMTSGFSRLRSSKGYNRFKDNLRRNLRSSKMGESVYAGLKNMKNLIRDSIVDGGIFGEFDLDYIGPVDGHNLTDLIQVFETVKHHEGPVVVHVITKKGNGYVPCENDRQGVWHGVGPFDVAKGKPLHGVPAGYVTWAGGLHKALCELAAEDERITCLTPAMIHGSELKNFFAQYPRRAFDCGIAEEHAATFAAGLAADGMRPYLCVYSSFLQRCYDQINHDICRMDLPVVIGIDHAGLVGGDGETHHGVFDIGLLTPLPNMILAQPRNLTESRNLMYTAFHQDHPFAIRFPKGQIPDQADYQMKPIEIGTWEVLNDCEQNKAVIFAYGEDVDKILEKVTVNQIPATVINCRFFKPIDHTVLEQMAARRLPMFIYEPDMLVSGLGSRILEYLNAKNIQANPRRFGLPDEYIPQGGSGQLRRDEKISINDLMNEVIAVTGESAE